MRAPQPGWDRLWLRAGGKENSGERRMTGSAPRMVLGCVVSVVFLWLALRGVDFREMMKYISSSNYWLVLVAAIMNIFNLWLRAVRWRLLLLPLKRLVVNQVFPATMVGFMVNNLLPARSGELFKAYVLSEEQEMSKASTIGTVVVERVFDGATLLLLLAGVLPFMPLRGFGWIRPLVVVAAAVWACIIALLFFLHRGWESALGIIRRILGADHSVRFERVLNIVPAFVNGLTVVSLRRAGVFASVLTLSALIWLFMFLNVFFVMVSLNLMMSPYVSAFVLAVQSLSMLIPSGPAHIGTYQFVTVAALGLFSVGDSQALGLSLVLHATRFFPTTLIGLFYFVRWIRRGPKRAVLLGF